MDSGPLGLTDSSREVSYNSLIRSGSSHTINCSYIVRTLVLGVEVLPCTVNKLVLAAAPNAKTIPVDLRTHCRHLQGITSPSVVVAAKPIYQSAMHANVVHRHCSEESLAL